MKKLALILAIAVVVLGAGAGYLWRQLDAERHQNADLQARLKSMQAWQQASGRFSAQTVPSPASPSEPQAPPADPATARARRQEAARPGIDAALARARQTLATPEGQKAVSGILRAMLPLRYPDLARVLNLGPAEADRLFELLSSQQNGQLSQFAGGASMQDLAGKAQETRQANEAQIAALLGDKYPQWQEYQNTLPARQQVNSLQGVLGTGGDKLSDTQSEQLISALAAEQQRINQDAGNLAPASGDNAQERWQQQQQRTAQNNQRLVDAASAYLNAGQLDSYKALLDRQSAGPGAALRMLGGRGAAGPVGPPVP
ncbi:MAG TPA: hypothetical protein VMH77_02305 [Steroidobacteraceae bacterium]|nr:hypothetical protein [Steroidobacteraceae bacterium]